MDKGKLHAVCLSLTGVTHDYQPAWHADRYHIGGKMFALIGGDSKGQPILTLKCNPVRAEELREMSEGIIPGYHMNKTHWNSIYLDSPLSYDLVENLIQHSYQLVFNKLPKKMQKELVSE